MVGVVWLLRARLGACLLCRMLGVVLWLRSHGRRGWRGHRRLVFGRAGVVLVCRFVAIVLRCLQSLVWGLLEAGPRGRRSWVGQ